MAASPKFKIYDPDGEYIASCKYAEDAAWMAGRCEGTKVKLNHRKVMWVEGEEEFLAADSFDGAAEVIREREGDI